MHVLAATCTHSPLTTHTRRRGARRSAVQLAGRRTEVRRGEAVRQAGRSRSRLIAARPPCPLRPHGQRLVLGQAIAWWGMRGARARSRVVGA